MEVMLIRAMAQLIVASCKLDVSFSTLGTCAN